MAPEYGATMGFFPIDAESVNYLRATGRTPEQIEAFETYFKAQKLFGIPDKAAGIVYSQDIELNLADVTPNVAGPKRPQDRIALPELKTSFLAALDRPVTENGFGKKGAEGASRRREAQRQPSRRRRHDQERQRAHRRHHQLHQHQQSRRS